MPASMARIMRVSPESTWRCARRAARRASAGAAAIVGQAVATPLITRPSASRTRRRCPACASIAPSRAARCPVPGLEFVERIEERARDASDDFVAVYFPDELIQRPPAAQAKFSLRHAGS